PAFRRRRPRGPRPSPARPAHRAFRTTKRANPSSSTISTRSWPAFWIHAGMSVRDPASDESTSITSPTRPSRMAPMSDISGPGQGMPRASIERVTFAVVMSITPSDEGHGAVDVHEERRDPLLVVDEWIEILHREAEHLHRQGARVDRDLTDRLGLPERVAPVLPAVSREDGRSLRTGLRSHPVVLGDPVRPKRVERPVLQKHIHLASHGRGAGGQNRRRVQLVVGPGEQDQGERLAVHVAPPIGLGRRQIGWYGARAVERVAVPPSGWDFRPIPTGPATASLRAGRNGPAVVAVAGHPPDGVVRHPWVAISDSIGLDRRRCISRALLEP